MRDIPTLEGRFKVSRDGIVRSYPNQFGNGKVIKCHKTPQGYLKFGYIKDGGGHTNMLVHRAVALAFIPNPDSKPCVNHIDSNRSNNKAENLEWCTQKENVAHARTAGLMDMSHTVGENHHMSILNEDQVRYIRSHPGLHLRETCTWLSEVFGVKRCTIYDIRNGRRWKHVKS